MTSTFFAVLLDAIGNIPTVHRDRLSSHLFVNIELLLQSAEDYRQIYLSHLHNTEVGHKCGWLDVLEHCEICINY